MRSSVAKIIKIIAIIIWVLGFIVGIVMGSAGSVAGYSYSGSFSFWTMLLYWIGVMGVFYYAFGELVENVAELRGETAERLDRMTQTMERMVQLMGPSAAMPSQPAPVAPQAAPAMPHPAPAEPERQTQPSAPYIPAAEASGEVTYRRSELQHPYPDYITCPRCEAHQPANRNVCWKCGARFVD